MSGPSGHHVFGIDGTSPPAMDTRHLVAGAGASYSGNSSTGAQFDVDPVDVLSPANSDSRDGATPVAVTSGAVELNGVTISVKPGFDAMVRETTYFRPQTIDASGRDITFEGYSPSLLLDSAKATGFTVAPTVEVTQFVLPLALQGNHDVELLIFEQADSISPAAVFPMEEAGVLPETGARRFTVALEGVSPGVPYAFRVNGGASHVEPHRWALDPKAKLTEPGVFIGERRGLPSDVSPDNFAPPKAVVVDVAALQRSAASIAPLEHPRHSRDVSIYQLHTDFTASIPDERLPEAFQGTQGKIKCLASPPVIEHLTNLGIDCIQIMPLQARSPESRFNNVWGYNGDGLFALDSTKFVASNGEPTKLFEELHEVISTLHSHGIRVILDGVFGHTSENCDARVYTSRGGDLRRDKRDDPHYQVGPSHSHRVFDPKFYLVDEQGAALDLTNCGHTVNFTGERGERLMEDLIEFWVKAAGFDGFRLDQGSIFGRRADGSFDGEAPALAVLDRFVQQTGAFVSVEPCDSGFASADSFLGYHSFEGKFPRNIHEQRLSFAHLTRMFFGHQSVYEVPGVGRSTMRALANSCHSSNGVNFPVVHDGMTLRDHANALAKQLTSPSPSDGRRIINLPPQRVEGRMLRALLASTSFVPGARLLFQGSEIGKSNNGNHDAFQMKESVTGHWDLTPEEREVLLFTQQLNDLRERLTCLRHGRMPSMPEVTEYPTAEFVNTNGEIVDVGYFENPRVGRGATLFEQGGGSAFGVLYTRWKGWVKSEGDYKRECFFERFTKESDGLPTPVLILRANSLVVAQLPDPGPRHVWGRIFNSSEEDCFKRVLVGTHSGRQVDLLIGPAVAVYVLKRRDTLRG